MKSSLFNPEASRKKLNFNPEGFDWAKTLEARKEEEIAQKILLDQEAQKIVVDLKAGKIDNLPPAQKPEFYGKHRQAFVDCQPVELIDYTSLEERQVVINTAYKQVFGNAHLMESEKLPEVESQLCSGEITVMEFIRQLAKSERYRVLFFDTCTNVRAIELNFKHLLGRAPENYQEISQHIQILAQGGFEAEIDSYLDSDEYFQSFGTNIVPYYRGYETQTGKNLAGYTHSFQLLRGASSSDRSNSINSAPRLQGELLGNEATQIKPLSAAPGFESIRLSLEPVKEEESSSVKDLEIRNLGYQPSELSTDGVSPSTWLQEYRAREAAATFPAARASQPVKLSDSPSEEEIEVVIRAAYKQVFGNAHLMESERLLMAETRLKNRQITIKGFIRELANSDLYRSLFFESCSNIRTIELNFKHLLGRTPDSSEEISEHSAILLEEGLEAEINSYLDSREYAENFGTDTVPYYVSYSTQTGKNVAGYNRIFQLMNGSSSSDRSIGASIASGTKSQLQKSILKKASANQLIIFKSLDLETAKSIGFGSYMAQQIAPVVVIPSVSEVYANAFADNLPLELVAGDSVTQQDLVIRAAYKQVFGNAHLMESEKLPQVESQLRSGEITVLEFIRQLAKSDRYRALFFEGYTNLRFIELNFKHLLGRAPQDQAEISQHIQILVEQGFDAEIDSYLDSDEYTQNFGTNIVPFYRGYNTQTGKNLAGYTHFFQLLRGACSSNKSTFNNPNPKLAEVILQDLPSPINDISSVPENIETIDADQLDSNTANSSVSETEMILPAIDPTDPTEIIRRTLGLTNYADELRKKKALALQAKCDLMARENPVQYLPTTISYKYTQAFADIQPVVHHGCSGDELELIIEAVYQQVFGNVHLMESEKISEAESQFRNGKIKIPEFLSKLAKSDRYRDLFFNNCSNLRAIELNFKHLLGRAPESHAEISEHISILARDGFEAEIDSYIFSEEYRRIFGDNTVPYYRGFATQIGKNVLGYNNSFQLVRGASSSDYMNSSNSSPKLQNSLIQNNPNMIVPLSSVPLTAPSMSPFKKAKT